MSNIHAPGLNREDKRGTYFSILPSELIIMLDYYYYFPIKIKILSVSKGQNGVGDYNVTTEIMRYCNGELRDTIYMDFSINDVIEFISNGKEGQIYPTFDPEWSQEIYMQFAKIRILPNQIEIYMNTMYDTIKVMYNEYDTKIFLQKLKLIQNQINEYILLGLRRSEIKNRLVKYSY